jgi:hypothetical protein
MLIHCYRDVFIAPLHSNKHGTDHKRKNTALLLLHTFTSIGMFTEPLPMSELFQLAGVMSQYILEYGSAGLICILQQTEEQLNTFFFEEFYFSLPDMPCNVLCVSVIPNYVLHVL